MSSDQNSPLSINRRMAAASAAVCRERDTIHLMTEVDVSKARRLLRELRDHPEGGVSLTAYIVASLARAVAEHRKLNALVTRGRLVMLDDVTIGVLVERIVAGEPVPEPVAIKGVDKLTVRQITDRLHAAQQAPDHRLGGLSGATWVRFVPAFLFKAMIRWASRNVRMAQRYGVISVTSIGMFVPGPTWLLPLSASTIALGVGGIVERPGRHAGEVAWREHLCLTVSFDHDIVDGAPAARFTARLREILESAVVLDEIQGT